MKKDIEQKLEKLKSEGIHLIKLGITDIDGVLRGKYISLDKFASIINGKGGFCDCILGWDVNDELYDNASFTGWHTGFPDALYHLDLSTERRLPDENNIPFYLGELLKNAEQESHAICPRPLLARVLKRAEDMGYGVNSSFEYEFFIFRETPHSVREKNYQNLTPLSPDMFGYSVLRANWLSDYFNSLMDYMKKLDIELEGLHCETGPGVWEAAIMYDAGISAADKAILFKTFTKSFFQKQELMATFMAKWSMDYPGQSGHLHLSLFDLKNKKPVFYDESASHNISKEMEYFTAGVQKYLRPFLVMTAGSINSYTRLTKGAWAPTAATWGIDNRTTALRIIPGSKKSQRLEFRVGAADSNPYLTSAATIGAGLLGIEQKLPLTDPVAGNAYDIQDDLPEEMKLSSNLLDALRLFNDSSEARDLFGDEFVNHLVSTREWEVRENEKHVNDWQLKRYFEII